jgi:hypothetical protein
MDCPVSGYSYIFTYTMHTFYILLRLRALAAKKYIAVFRDWPFKAVYNTAGSNKRAGEHVQQGDEKHSGANRYTEKTCYFNLLHSVLAILEYTSKIIQCIAFTLYW